MGKFIDKSKTAIKEILRSAVEKAVVAKCFLYCNNEARNVTIKIKSRYQKLSAISEEASFLASSLNPEANICVIKFENTVTNNDKINIIINNFLKTSHEKRGLYLAFAKLGKKLCVKAPSANIRLNRFGNLKATKKISEYIFAPSTEALNKSRMNPKILELKIPRKLTIIDLNILGIIPKRIAKLGLFNFLKKEEKKQMRIAFPLITKTENVNEALLKISSSNNIPLSALDFRILSFETYIKIGDNDFVEFKEEHKELIKTEEFLINEKNEIKQVYNIEINKYTSTKGFELIGEIQTNQYMTHAVYIVKPNSLLTYTPELKQMIKTELNKKKIRNSMLIELFDDKMNSDIDKIVAKVRILGHLEKEETIELCKCLDPVENLEGKVIYHYLKNKEDIKKDLIFPVKKGEILIEIIKPVQGRNGRNCKGKIILIPPIKDFNIPSIGVNPDEIQTKETEEKILYIALKNGYIYKDGDSYSIKDKMEVKQINLKTGNVRGAKETDVHLDVKESDALKEAIADNMTVETTILNVRGNVGKAAKINAKELMVEGQTHQKALIKADKADINIHKGYIEGKEIKINRLEGGTVKGKKVKIKQTIGGKIIAEEVEFDIVGSHVEVFALKEIKINKLKGGENRFVINPIEVLGKETDAEKLEKRVKEIMQNINIKTKEYNKRKEVLMKNKPTIEKLKKTYKQQKAQGIKVSPHVIKKIKEYNSFRDKALELKNDIALLKNDLKELQETLQNFQTAIFNAKIINLSPWTSYNRVEFDMIEPPLKLTYDTKGDEGMCGFKLKDYGDAYKIVRIKDDNDSSSKG